MGIFGRKQKPWIFVHQPIFGERLPGGAFPPWIKPISMKTIQNILAAGILLLTGITTPLLHASPAATETDRAPVRNVIVMIPDGCSQSIQTLARWIRLQESGKPLHLDGINAGVVLTHNANSIITDSASAATALATGHKTTVRFIGVGASSFSPYYNRDIGLLTGFEPDSEPFVPLASILEGAKQVGKSTGVVATSRVSHATPGGYVAHVHDRGMENEIMEQAVYQDIDVVFSGGARYLVPAGSAYTTSFGEKWNGARSDGENLIEALLARDVQFVDSRETMLGLERGPAWGMFDDDAMDPDIDRDELHPTQPSLAEMTSKAIELLNQDDDGFFLMVEGSQVDWGGHSNDFAYMVSEFIAFDEAVGVALDFARKDGQTQVLVFADHDTGGLTIGHELSSFPPSSSRASIESLIDPVKDVKMTLQGFLPRISKSGVKENGDRFVTPDDVIQGFTEALGPYWEEHLNADHAGHIANLLNTSTSASSTYYQICRYVSLNLTNFGWTTHGHSGVDVPLWAYGPNPVYGTFDNTDLAHLCAASMGFELMEMTGRLFVDAIEAFPAATIDTSDEANPVLVIGEWRIPANKDYIHSPDGQKREFNSITVYAPQLGKMFIPREAVEMIQP
jgi:alkaline phosphatase